MLKKAITSKWKKGFYGVLILMLLFTMLMQGNSRIFAVSNVIQVDNPEALPTGVLYQDNQIMIGAEADGSRLVFQGSTTTNTISIASGVTNLTLILNGVSITSSEQSPIQLLGAGNIVIELADGTRNLLDAQLTSSKAALRTGNTGILTINGTSGTLDVLGGLNGAAIGGGDHEPGGTITINGGVITATGGKQGAAIGGGLYGGSGIITINGGTITAIGGRYSAGIGGGHAGGSDHIVITGGSVKANGGEQGAGIGGGNQRTAGWIEISGGEIDATGGRQAAGIGGGFFRGYSGPNGSIDISGGRIKAVGGLGGAGIGGGLANSAGNININGGVVTAIGNGNSAGIGNGETGQLNNIQIGELATVLAQSSNIESIGANGQSSGQLVKGKLSVVLNESQKTYLKAGSVVMPIESNYNYFAVSGVEATQIEVYADEACTTKLYDIGTLLGDRLIPVSDTIYANSTEVDYAPRMVKNNKIILTSSNPMIVTKELLEAKDVFVEDGNIIYKVLDAPKHGQLERVSAAGVAITQFSQQDLTDKQVCYIYDGNKGTSDSFNFSLYDGTTESVAYTANIELNITYYTVIFKDYDGTVLKTESVEKNNGATAPTIESRTGYSFIGWDQGFDTVTADKTVTAQYQPNQYDVSFNSAGGTEVTSIKATYNTTITSPTEPIKENYVFSGWYKDIDFKNPWNFGTDKMPASNVTLYAKWVPTQDSITMTVSPSGLETNENMQQLFVIRVNNDTLTDAINQSDIELKGSFDTLSVGEIKAISSTEFSVVISGNLANSGTGYIVIKPNKLLNRTTELRGDVLVEAKPEYSITYIGNGAVAGGVPVDAAMYYDGDKITLLGNINNLYRSGYSFGGWNTQSDGLGSYYNQGDTLTVNGSNVTVYAMWNKNSGGTSNHHNNTTNNTKQNVQVIINGKKENAGIETTIDSAGKKMVNFEVQADVVISMIEAILKEQKEEGISEEDNVLQIPIHGNNANQMSAVLTGDVIKHLEEDDFNISIDTGDINYIIPAKDINIEKLAKEWSLSTNQLEQIKIEVKIVQVDQKTSIEMENMATASGYDLLYPPVIFDVVAKIDMKSGVEEEVMLTAFDHYVQRIIKLSDSIEANRITTGVVYNEDGSFSHIPTEIFVKENESYARLNSRTNSYYTLIENPTRITSVENHWSKEAVEDMASRLVLGNPEMFLPDKAVTRGEFAEYITKALGLYRTGVTVGSRYKDVDSTNAYAGAIEIASTYGLINGYTDGTFRANTGINYEEALVILSRAMDICGLVGKELSSSMSYIELEGIAEWSYEDVTKTLSADLIYKNMDKTIHLKDDITGAEALVAIRKLLIVSHLINE